MADRPTLTITVAENGMLTLEDIARLAGVRRQTVSFWASDKQPFARRLRVLRLGHSCVRVRPADWLKFQEANANLNR